MDKRKFLIPFNRVMFDELSEDNIDVKLYSRDKRKVTDFKYDECGNIICRFEGDEDDNFLLPSGRGHALYEYPYDLFMQIDFSRFPEFNRRIKEQAIKYAVDLIKPLPLQGGCGSCWSCDDKRSPEEKHRDSLRFNQELMDKQREQVILMAKEIEKFLSE